VITEGNHYFPSSTLKREYFQASDRDAAFPVPTPKKAAAEIEARVAFWKGVRVEPAA